MAWNYSVNSAVHDQSPSGRATLTASRARSREPEEQRRGVIFAATPKNALDDWTGRGEEATDSIAGRCCATIVAILSLVPSAAAEECENHDAWADGVLGQ